MFRSTKLILKEDFLKFLLVSSTGQRNGANSGML